MRFVRTSNFGDFELIRNHPHTGIDYSMPEGTPIDAIMDGVIKTVVDYGDANAGKTIIMQLDNGQEVVFGHLKEFLVKEGQKVSAGDHIALSGNTGHSTAPHLHIGLKDHGQFIDPSPLDPAVQKMGIGGSWDQLKEQGQVNQYSGADQSSWLNPDSIGEHMADAAIGKMGAFFHEMGIQILQFAPDGLILLGMIFCLGAIVGIGKCGKWAAGSVAAAVVVEVIKMGVMGT